LAHRRAAARCRAGLIWCCKLSASIRYTVCMLLLPWGFLMDRANTAHSCGAWCASLTDCMHRTEDINCTSRRLVYVLSKLQQLAGGCLNRRVVLCLARFRVCN
jgi:hypothetical protein